jgi:hypothetical protein
MLFVDYIEDMMIVKIKAFANFHDILGKDLRVELRKAPQSRIF